MSSPKWKRTLSWILIVFCGLALSAKAKPMIPRSKFTVDEQETNSKMNQKLFIKEDYSNEEIEDLIITQILSDYHKCMKAYEELMEDQLIKIRSAKEQNEKNRFLKKWNSLYSSQAECLQDRDSKLSSRRAFIKAKVKALSQEQESRGQLLEMERQLGESKRMHASLLETAQAKRQERAQQIRRLQQQLIQAGKEGRQTPTTEIGAQLSDRNRKPEELGLKMEEKMKEQIAKLDNCAAAVIKREKQIQEKMQAIAKKQDQIKLGIERRTFLLKQQLGEIQRVQKINKLQNQFLQRCKAYLEVISTSFKQIPQLESERHTQQQVSIDEIEDLRLKSEAELRKNLRIWQTTINRNAGDRHRYKQYSNKIQDLLLEGSNMETQDELESNILLFSEQATIVEQQIQQAIISITALEQSDATKKRQLQELLISCQKEQLQLDTEEARQKQYRQAVAGQQSKLEP